MTRKVDRKKSIAADTQLPEHLRKAEDRFDKEADAKTENQTESGKGGKIRADQMNSQHMDIGQDLRR